MPQVFDCFPFFNELDLLEIRLEELYEVVDHFVIVEAEETFSGKPKPFNLEENFERFAKFKPKITYIKMHRLPEDMGSWEREHAQKEKLIEGLANCRDSDIVLLSDLDEIVSADAVRRIRQHPPAPGEVYCLELRYFQFFLNLEVPRLWTRMGPRAARRNTFNSIRNLRRVRPPIHKLMQNMLRSAKASYHMRRIIKRTMMHDAGWHFSWLGGYEKVALKANAIPKHSNLPTDMGTLSGAERVVEDALNNLQIRKIGSDFPKPVREKRDRYSHLIVEDKQG